MTVKYHGVIKHEEVARELAGHDLFFLPTWGENFGHVIHEALAAGLPVLISDKTPWRNLEDQGVGWDLPLDAPEKFRRVIEDQSAVDSDVRASRKGPLQSNTPTESHRRKMCGRVTLPCLPMPLLKRTQRDNPPAMSGKRN